jgi:hypothetical protein
MSIGFDTRRIAEAPMRSPRTAPRCGCWVSCRAAAWPPFGSLAPGTVSKALAHRTVEEIWYFIAGERRMWHRLGEAEEVTDVARGVSVTIPTGVHFQFRHEGGEPLEAVAVTMPPRPRRRGSLSRRGKMGAGGLSGVMRTPVRRKNSVKPVSALRGRTRPSK